MKNCQHLKSSTMSCHRTTLNSASYLLDPLTTQIISELPVCHSRLPVEQLIKPMENTTGANPTVLHLRQIFELNCTMGNFPPQKTITVLARGINNSLPASNMSFAGA